MYGHGRLRDGDERYARCYRNVQPGMMRLLRSAMILLLVCAAGAQAQQASRTYVVAHGAWGGGWDWKTVDSLLTAQGHRVFRPDR